MTYADLFAEENESMRPSASRSGAGAPAEDYDAAREEYIRANRAALERDIEKHEKEERSRKLRQKVGTPIILVVISVLSGAFLYWYCYIRH